MKKDVISGFIWCVLFAFVLMFAYKLPANVQTYPSFVGWVGLIFSVAQFAKSTFKWIKNEKPACTAFFKDSLEKKRALIAAILVVGYVLIFKVIGYFASTLIFMFLFSHLMSNKQGKKRMINEGIATICFTFVIYFAFSMFLGIRLPSLF